jgi:CDP-diacylglycerol--glycerol-3-phosphate 3-phosphatidyltransferase
MSLPNQLSLLRILLTPVFLVLLFMDTPVYRWVALAVFVVASLTDWYDGYIARKFGVVSAWGKFLDPLADKVLISAGFIAFAAIGYYPFWMVVVIVLRDLLITGLRSYAMLKDNPMRTNLLAKAKTFGQFTILYIIFLYHLFSRSSSLEQIQPGLKWINDSNFILISMYLVTVVTALSGIVYFFENRSCIRKLWVDIRGIFIPSDV